MLVLLHELLLVKKNIIFKFKNLFSLEQMRHILFISQAPGVGPISGLAPAAANNRQSGRVLVYRCW